MHTIEVAILIVDGWKFHSTWRSEEDVKEVYNRFPSSTTKIEPFFVAIKKVDPITNEVTEWSSDKGWSMWTKDTS